MLHTLCLNIFHLELDLFQELLLFQRVESNLDRLCLVRLQTATSSQLNRFRFFLRLIVVGFFRSCLFLSLLSAHSSSHSRTGVLFGLGDLNRNSDGEFFGESFHARQFPVDRNGARVFENQILFGLLADKGALKLDHLLIERHNRFCTQALHIEDSWIRVVLQQADHFVRVKLGFLRECIDPQFKGFVHFEGGLLRFDKEG